MERTAKSIEQIEKVHQSLKRDFPEAWKMISKYQPEEDTAKVSALNLFGTLFASFLLKGKASLNSLKLEQVAVFIEKVFVTTGSGRILNSSLKKEFLTGLYPESEREALGIFWSFVFDAIEDELGSLDISKPLDPRFISCILTAPEKKTPKRVP